MSGFVNPAPTVHQGVERAEQSLQLLRQIANAIASFFKEVFNSLPQGWGRYISTIDKQ